MLFNKEAQNGQIPKSQGSAPKKKMAVLRLEKDIQSYEQ